VRLVQGPGRSLAYSSLFPYPDATGGIPAELMRTQFPGSAALAADRGPASRY